MSKETKRILFQIALFLLTFFSTTVAGNELAYGRNIFFTPDYGWQDFVNGLSFSVPLLFILTVHEFGHYFVALFHKVKTSLPYYIPIPPIPFLPSLGTMGAVIRMRSRPYSNIQSFDIGLAGPLAGFIAAVVIMIYGFATLPPPQYVFQFHPEYEKYGLNYADSVYTEKFRFSEANKRLTEYKKEDSIRVQKAIANNQPVEKSREVTLENFLSVDIQLGNTLAFTVLGKMFAEPNRIPNPHEIMHYPIMLACAIALLFTSLNLFPIGQLDGGHVVYGLFGFRAHKIIATICFVGLLFYSGLGLPVLNLSHPDWWSVFWITVYIAFDIYFPAYGLTSNQNVDFFVFREENGKPSNEEVLRISSVSIRNQGTNTFQRIRFLPALQITQNSFFIGWRQPISGQLLVGIDNSNDTGDKMFFNADGSINPDPGRWEPNTLIKGSFMVRPVFGTGVVDPTTGVEDTRLALYPNPNRGSFQITGKPESILIMSIAGQSIPFESETHDDKVFIRINVPSGLYIVRYRSGGVAHTQKVIVTE